MPYITCNQRGPTISRMPLARAGKRFTGYDTRIVAAFHHLEFLLLRVGLWVSEFDLKAYEISLVRISRILEGYVSG